MGDFVLKHSTANGVWYGEFTNFAALDIKHGISTRLGGQSSVPFASLNLGLHTGDDSGVVWHNRQKFCHAIGVLANKAVTAEQVHGDIVQIATEEDAGRGSQHYHEAIKGVDALITNETGLPLLLFFADCVPILFIDPINKAIGISHAGWKGTVAKIAQKTLLAMQQRYNTKPEDCLIGIGPSIGPCCYEVDEVVVNRLQTNFNKWEKLVIPRGNRWRFNLWEANYQQLIEIGVVHHNITMSNICTACNKDIFFSHRAEDGRTGRIGAVITL